MKAYCDISTEEEVRCKTKLSGAECHSSAVIGLDTATGDHMTAALIQRIR